MKRGAGRTKGNSFERKVANMLSEAACLTRKDCYRTPLSGGHPVIGQGDLQMSIAMVRAFPFVVECKHHKDWVPSLLFKQTEKFRSWFRQVIASSAIENRVPMLVVSGNSTGIYAIAPNGPFKDWGIKGVPYSLLRVEGALWRAVPFELVLKRLKGKQ